MKLNKNIKIFINYFLGPILFIWVCYSIYDQVQQQPRLGKSWRAIRISFGSPMIWNLVAVFFLMIVNWSIEAVKWKISVQRVQRVSFATAFKAVLAGTSFSATTPNRIGEYVGRVLYMKEGNRLKAISLTIAGSMSQLIVTLLMGLCGLVLLRESIESSNILPAIWVKAILLGTALVVILLIVCYFRLSAIIRWVEGLRGVRRFAWLLKDLERFNATLMLQLLSLSMLRFFVFIIQYYLLFRLYKVDVSLWEGWWTVSVSFLVMAVIPTIALITDLGLRGKVSAMIVSLFSSNYLGIGLTSVSIWFINMVVPALAGSVLILNIKRIFKNTKDESV